MDKFAVVEDGVVVNIAVAVAPLDERWVPFQEGCLIGMTWDGESFAVPPVTPEVLAELKSQKNEQINRARLKANRTTFTHGGKDFACDELSRSDIDGINGYVSLVGDLPPGWPGGWKAADNTMFAIPDVPAWGAFYASMVAAGNANFAKAQVLKALLAAATTPEQVAAISWS